MHPTNARSRLRSGRTKLAATRWALCAFPSQDHHVGTAPRPPFRSAQPINPNRTARWTRAASFDHLVGASEQCRGYREAERLCGLEIEDQLEWVGRTTGNSAGFAPLIT